MTVAAHARVADLPAIFILPPQMGVVEDKVIKIAFSSEFIYNKRVPQ